jgi:hypothetical protein
MKNNKTQLAVIVAAALVSMTQAHAETMKITSQFTPLENLSAQTRTALQKKFEVENPFKYFDWSQVIMGTNENNMIEVRDLQSLQLQAVSEPTCVGTGA